MHIHFNIPISSQLRFAGMQTNAYPYRCTAVPGMLCEGSLNGCGSHNCIGGMGEGDEEGISLRVHLVAVVLDEYFPQQLPTIGQHVGIMLIQLLQEMRRVFHIGEEQRHGSSG